MSDSSPHPSTASPSYSQPKPCDLSLEPEKQNEQTDNDLGRRDSDSLDHTDTSVPTNAQKYPSTLTSSSDGLLSTTSQQACQIIYSKPITDPAPEPTPIQDDTGDNQEEIASQKSQSQGSTASAQSARSSDRLPIDSASKSPPKDELAGKMEEKLQVTTAEQNWKGINSTSKKGKERSPYPQRSEVRKISVGGVKQKSKEVNTMKNLEEKLKGGKERQRFQWARPTSDLLKQRGVDLPRYLGSLSTPPAHLRNILEPPPDPKPIHRRVSFATEIEFINGPYSTPSGSSSLPSSRPREISPVSLSRPESSQAPYFSSDTYNLRSAKASHAIVPSPLTYTYRRSGSSSERYMHPPDQSSLPALYPGPGYSVPSEPDPYIIHPYMYRPPLPYITYPTQNTYTTDYSLPTHSHIKEETRWKEWEIKIKEEDLHRREKELLYHEQKLAARRREEEEAQRKQEKRQRQRKEDRVLEMKEVTDTSKTTISDTKTTVEEKLVRRKKQETNEEQVEESELECVDTKHYETGLPISPDDLSILMEKDAHDENVFELSSNASVPTILSKFHAYLGPSPPQLPPSITTVHDIQILTSLSLDSVIKILLALEASTIPQILDLLQTQIQVKASDHDFRQKCGKYLRLLVKEYHILPPSLFVEEVTQTSVHISAVGTYSDIYEGSLKNKRVCLKVLRVHIQKDEEHTKSDLYQFYKEALLWTHFSHPNILPFYGVNATLFPGKLCLVSPWMVNGDLVKFLKSNPSHDKLKATIDIASGIMYLHSQNIVHGDIKGANVVVDEQGQCYLTDFGLAIACMTTTLLSRATTYTGKGTIRWMAPELLGLSDEEDDESLEPDNTPKLSSDTYAYACTIYEIVAGTIPFANLKDGKVVLKVVNGKRPPRPQAVSWCPDSIWGVVEQCWKQESHLRPTAADVHAFLTHLERRRKEGLPWEEEVFNHVQEDN